jgi:uncharacterized protein
MHPGVARGIHLFNTRKFLEAHEALEEVWLKAHGDEKLLLHGLIQVAAAFHHHTRHNHAGFRSLLEKGSQKLDLFGAHKNGIDLAALRQQLRSWREYLGHAHQVEAPPLPSIKGVSTLRPPASPSSSRGPGRRS